MNLPSQDSRLAAAKEVKEEEDEEAASTPTTSTRTSSFDAKLASRRQSAPAIGAAAESKQVLLETVNSWVRQHDREMDNY